MFAPGITPGLPTAAATIRTAVADDIPAVRTCGDRPTVSTRSPPTASSTPERLFADDSSVVIVAGVTSARLVERPIPRADEVTRRWRRGSSFSWP
jgi:hypothetical protein